MYYRKTPLRFACTGCGACCTGEADHYVEVGRREQQAIRDHLGLSHGWFRRRYLVRVDRTTVGIRLGRDGRCPFLDGDNRCRVYPVRPMQCRTFPWWPEVVASKAAWQRAARRCEGIGRGREVIPIETIEAALRRRSR